MNTGKCGAFYPGYGWCQLETGHGGPHHPPGIFFTDPPPPSPMDETISGLAEAALRAAVAMRMEWDNPTADSDELCRNFLSAVDALLKAEPGWKR